MGSWNFDAFSQSSPLEKHISLTANEEKLGKGKKSYAVSFIFQDPLKTLKDKEVEKIMNKLIETYEGKLGAVIRR